VRGEGWWLLSFLVGGVIGASEIALRYRIDPLHPLKTLYGIFYLLLNAMIALGGFWVLARYAPVLLPTLAKDQFLLLLVGTFGSALLMRSKLLTFRGDDNREYPLGPDLILMSILHLLDKRIERTRAVENQRMIFRKMKDLDDFELASQYTKASLLSFEGLSDTDRTEIAESIDDYCAVDWPDGLKLMALGFAILSIAGEKNFDSFLDGLKSALSKAREDRPKELEDPELEQLKAH
jgi:hypothetical protein